MPKVIKPIFFIGMGSSGSSIIFDTFMQHRGLAFFSQYCSKKYVKSPQLTALHRFFCNYRPKNAHNLSYLKKLTPTSRESYKLWKYLCGNKFPNSFLRNIKATHEEKTKTKNYISKLLFYQGKNRFATKLTGPPRIEFLTSIFEDIVFIDIIRDPRAVVNSLLNVDFRKIKSLTTPYWDDSLADKDEIEWNKFDRSAISLAALEWRSVYRLTKLELNKVEPNYMRIKYEDFIDSPQNTLKTILKFVGLDYTYDADKFIKKTNFFSTNHKFRDNLSVTDINTINSICEKEIDELGYNL
ncbi:sulfotransferase [Candidatus Neomarinimicrobiota bacterium]